MEEKEEVPFIFVATPMYGGMCHGTFATSLLTMVNAFTIAKTGFTFSHMMNESLITRARDSLANDFLDTPQCTHLMFIDSDIGFNPNDIIPMIKADKDIICGLYPKKEINWNQIKDAVEKGVQPKELGKYTGVFVVNAVDDSSQIEVKLQEPIEIANGGTGFMLIKRNVLETLKDVVPTYNSDMYKIVDTERKPRKIYQFFDTSIDKDAGDRLLSEDYHFCKLARSNGFKVWAAPWAELSHTGSYTFSGFLPRA
jgi:hypothetical protein